MLIQTIPSFHTNFSFHLENNDLATVPLKIDCYDAREYKEFLICFDAFPCTLIDFYIFKYLTQPVVNTSDIVSVCMAGVVRA